MWAVLYDDGTSLTTVSEPIAHSLAAAERQRGRQATVRRVDDVDSAPRPEPDRPVGRMTRPEPVSEPGLVLEPGLVPEPAPGAGSARAAEPASVAEPARPAEPTPAAEPTRAAGAAGAAGAARGPEPARAVRPARRRRLLPYALAAASIVVAAALADHWNVLPRVGTTASSSSAQVSGPPHRPQLLPPLDQLPVMHFSNTARGG